MNESLLYIIYAYFKSNYLILYDKMLYIYPGILVMKKIRKNKLFLFIVIYLFYSNLSADTLQYKNLNDEKDSYYTLIYPDDCANIIKIYDSSKYSFKDKENSKKIFSKCKLYGKGKNVKDGLKAGSDAVLNTGVKVKEGFKKGTESLSGAVAKEADLFIDDTKKITQGIIGGTEKVIGATIDKGGQVKDGISSFLKGIFSSSN